MVDSISAKLERYQGKPINSEDKKVLMLIEQEFGAPFRYVDRITEFDDGAFEVDEAEDFHIVSLVLSSPFLIKIKDALINKFQLPWRANELYELLRAYIRKKKLRFANPICRKY